MPVKKQPAPPKPTRRTKAAKPASPPPPPPVVKAKPVRRVKKDTELLIDDVLLDGKKGRVRLTGNEDFQLLCLILLRILTYGRRVWPHEYTDRTDPGVCKHCKMVDDALEIMKQRLVRFE